MSDINAATINATTGFKFPIVTSSSRPSVQTGLTVFNSDTSSFELYDGNDWVAIGGASDLDGSSAAKAAPDAAWIWDNRPDKTTGMSNALKWIKLPGTSTAYQIWCNFENNGGGGPAGTRHGWMTIYQNYGGPRAAGTLTIQGQNGGSGASARQYDIWNSSSYYDNILIPRKEGGQYVNGKTHIWDLVKNDPGWDVMKCYKLYNSSNNVVTYDMTGYTDAGNMSPWNQGAYCLSRNTRQVYDILSTRNVTLRSIFGDSMNSPGSSLNNFVGLFLDSGNHGGNFDWGEANTLTISGSSNRGFSNNSDNVSTPRMYGWAARHWISYASNDTGRNAHRCQFICWGSEDYAIEISYLVRRNYTYLDKAS